MELFVRIICTLGVDGESVLYGCMERLYGDTVLYLGETVL